jgi:hypothetical protein
MNKKRIHITSGRAALALTTIGVSFALATSAFSSGSAVPGRGGVQSDDIAPRAVNAKKLADHAVGPKKLKPATVRSATETVEAGTSEAVSASCPANEYLLSGGFDVAADIDVRVLRSRPGFDNSWQVLVHNYSGANTDLTAYAYCLF